MFTLKLLGKNVTGSIINTLNSVFNLYVHNFAVLLCCNVHVYANIYDTLQSLMMTYLYNIHDVAFYS